MPTVSSFSALVQMQDFLKRKEVHINSCKKQRVNVSYSNPDKRKEKVLLCLKSGGKGILKEEFEL